MDWNKRITRRVMESGADYPGVQLQFLLQRLEKHPETIPAISEAIRDMGKWYLEHAAELEAEGVRLEAQAKLREIAINTPK